MNKGQVIEEAAIRFERHLPAPVEKVWAFLTEPARLSGWYGEATLEPREGGRIDLMGGHVRGVITGWRPNEFLAYTWNVYQPGETSASGSAAVGQKYSTSSSAAVGQKYSTSSSAAVGQKYSASRCAAVGQKNSPWPVTYLEFTLAGGDNTHLTLTHRPIPGRMQPQTMMGWHTFLNMLEAGALGREVEARVHYMQKNAALYGADLNNLER